MSPLTPFYPDRLKATLEGSAIASGTSLEDATAERMAENPSGRFGDPSEFGEFCAFICSDQAGYITGQNLLINVDGYPSTF